jgi:hypothetical protein
MKIDELRASLTKESIRSEQARTLVGSRAVDRAPASLRLICSASMESVSHLDGLRPQLKRTVLSKAESEQATRAQVAPAASYHFEHP